MYFFSFSISWTFGILSVFIFLLGQDASAVSTLQTNQSGFHLFKGLQNPHVEDELGILGTQEKHRGAYGLSYLPHEPLGGASEEDSAGPGPSLDPKYLSQSFHEEEEEVGSWSNCPEDVEFHQG